MWKMSACCLLIDFNVCQPFSVLPGHMYDGWLCVTLCHNSRPSNVQLLIVWYFIFFGSQMCNGNSPIYRFYKWFATKTSISWWISHRISLQNFPPAGCRIALRAMYSCMRQLLDGSDAEAPSWCPHFFFGGGMVPSTWDLRVQFGQDISATLWSPNPSQVVQLLSRAKLQCRHFLSQNHTHFSLSNRNIYHGNTFGILVIIHGELSVPSIQCLSMSCIQHEALNDANIFHFTHTYAYSILRVTN